MIGSNLFDIIKRYDERNRKKSIKELRAALREETISLTEYNEDGDMSTHYAVKSNKAEMLEILILEGNASIYSKNNDNKTIEDVSPNDVLTAFIFALKEEMSRRGSLKHHRQLYDILISAHKNSLNRKSLLTKLQKRIIKKPSELNKKIFYGRNACHVAAFFGFPKQIIEFLVEKGGDLFEEDLGKKTPEHLDVSERGFIKKLRKKQSEKHNKILFGSEDPAVNPLITGLKSLKISSVSSIFGIMESSDRKGKKEKKSSQRNETPRISHRRTKSDSQKPRDVLSIDNRLELRRLYEKNKKLLMNLQTQEVISAIDNEDIPFLKKFFPSKGDPNERIAELKNRPSYLFYAFSQNKVNSFFALIATGARISLANDIITYIHPRKDHHFDISTNEEHFNFFCTVQKKLSLGLDFDVVKTRSVLKNLEMKFAEQLTKKGLKPIFDLNELIFLTENDLNEISTSVGCREDFVANVYEACSCLPIWDRPFVKEEKKEDEEESEEKPIINQFNPHYLREMVIGLLARPDVRLFDGEPSPSSKVANFIPIVLMEVISELYPKLSRGQKLILIAMVKEIIVWDDFNNSAQNGFFNIRLKRFCKLINENFKDDTSDGKDISELLKKIKRTKSQMYHPECTALMELDSILMRFKLNPAENMIRKEIQLAIEEKKSLKNVACMLANDIRVLSYQFYCLVHPSEFEKYSKKEKYIPEQDFPNIAFKVDMFDSITFFFIGQILYASTNENRAKLIIMTILTIEQLINFDVPDYDGALSVYAALAHNTIRRLTNSFDLVDEQFKVKLKKFEEILSPIRNFHNQRSKMMEVVGMFPSLPIYAKDFTFFNENAYPEIAYLPKSNDPKLPESYRYPLMGKTYLDIFQRQHYFRTMPRLKPLSDFPFVLINLIGMLKSGEERLYQYSIRLQLPILILEDEARCPEFEEIVKLYMEKGASFKIHYQKVLRENEEAIKSIIEWLKSLLNLKEKPISLKEANRIFGLACKAIVIKRLSINLSLYYQQLHEATPEISHVVFSNPYTTSFNQEKSTGERKLFRARSGHSEQVRIGLGRGYDSDGSTKTDAHQSIRRNTEPKLQRGTFSDISSTDRSSMDRSSLDFTEADISSTDISPRNEIFFGFSPENKNENPSAYKIPTSQEAQGLPRGAISPRHQGELSMLSTLPNIGMSTTVTSSRTVNPLPPPTRHTEEEEEEQPVKTPRRSLENP